MFVKFIVSGIDYFEEFVNEFKIFYCEFKEFFNVFFVVDCIDCIVNENGVFGCAVDSLKKFFFAKAIVDAFFVSDCVGD